MSKSTDEGSSSKGNRIRSTAILKHFMSSGLWYTPQASFSGNISILTTLSRPRFWVRRFANLEDFTLAYWILG